MTTALEGGEGSASRPGRSLPPGKTWYALYRRLGGPQGRSGQVQKISPPPGFDPRTVQPIASRYTDYATRPTIYGVAHNIIYCGHIKGSCVGHIWSVYEMLPNVLVASISTFLFTEQGRLKNKSQTTAVFSVYRKKMSVFLCIVYCASLYNLVNKSNWVHNSVSYIYLLISLLNMFRASTCPPSGENCCIYVTLVFATHTEWQNTSVT